MHFNVIGPDLREYELIDEATLRRWLRQRRLDLVSPARESADTRWRTVADPIMARTRVGTKWLAVDPA